MTAEHMSGRVQDFLFRANDLQWKKNKDYHPDNVAFLEILRTCAETGITVEQDLWAKFRKQMIALRTYMIEGKVESEPPRMRRIDIAVYIGMMDFWDENKRRIVSDCFDFVRDRTPCEKTDGQFSCIGQALPKLERCDRCQFLGWLSDRAY